MNASMDKKAVEDLTIREIQIKKTELANRIKLLIDEYKLFDVTIEPIKRWDNDQKKYYPDHDIRIQIAPEFLD